MPTYDYVCEACGHEFEHFQAMSDKRLTRCPACSKRRLVRKVGAGAGVIFRGTGFYQTDYKNKSGGEPSKPAEDGQAASKEAPAGCDGPCATQGPGACEKPSSSSPASGKPAPSRRGAGKAETRKKP